MNKFTVKSILALSFIFISKLINAQWVGVLPDPLSTTQNVKIGVNSTGRMQSANLHIFRDLNPFNIGPVVIEQPANTSNVNCYTVLLNLSKNKYNKNSGGGIFAPGFSLSSVPTWSIDIDENSDKLSFSFSNWIGYPKSYQKLNPFTGIIESVNECPIPKEVFSINTNEVVSSVELKVNNNITVEGTFRVKDQNGDNQFAIDNGGFVRAREVKVDYDIIPDYVFKKEYKLMPLDELEKYIEKEKHLPNIKSENEFNKKEGLNLGEMNLKLLEKVEELTLYLLQLKKQNDDLQSQINNLKKN